MTFVLRIILLVIAPQLAGCSGAGYSSAPSAPSPVPQAAPPPLPISLVVFTDFATGFVTSDVRDAQEQIMRFNTAGELIWTADDTRFRGYVVNGHQIRGPGRDDYFQVRFGTKNGERRAYLGWSDDYCHCPGYPATVVDVEVVSGQLITIATNLLVPAT